MNVAVITLNLNWSSMLAKLFHLFLFLTVSGASSFALAQQNRLPHELPTPDQVKTQIDSIAPSIVRFSYNGRGLGCGVIVSSEGHVAVSSAVSFVLDHNLPELKLNDGSVVRGEALGWSSEYGFGILKITEPKEWKFAKISNQVKLGEVCMALGYPRNTDSKNLPQKRLGLVSEVYKHQWFRTSYEDDFTGHPVFNMNGELLGLATSNSNNRVSTYNNAKWLLDHWKELVAGVNLDRKRLFEETKPPLESAGLPRKISDDSLSKAKAASVQIGQAGKKPTFSGVIVSGGYVITCAHHGRVPGDRLEITLADGRTAETIVRGTNRITDTCLLKITDPGEWPFVNIGYSSLLVPEKPVVLIGYPLKNKHTPLVIDLSIAKGVRGMLKRRDSLSTKLFLKCDDEKVVTNLQGASGGGVFDTAGNVVAVVNSTSSGWEAGGKFFGSIFTARGELFSKNWEKLAKGSVVEVLDEEILENALPEITKLMKGL